MDLLLFKRSRLADRQVHFRDFTRPFEMLKYFAVAIPSVFYMACFGYGTVLFAATGAQLFGELYHFHTEQTGLLLSIPLLIGCLIGEFNAGWVTDWMSNRYARTHNGERLPEARLNAIWGAVLVPVGVIIQGVCLSHSKTVGWIGTAFGMGIAGLGLQISTTVIYAYITDVSCHIHMGPPYWLEHAVWLCGILLTCLVCTVLQAAKRRDLDCTEHFPPDLLMLHLILCVCGLPF